MPRIYIISCVIVLLILSLTLKASRYLNVSDDMEAQVGEMLVAHMQSYNAKLQHKHILTSGGVFARYDFTHPNCKAVFSITPLFKSAEAISLFPSLHDIQFHYREYQGEDFPQWDYMWQEGLVSIYSAFDKEKRLFPTVLAVKDISACMEVHAISLSTLWP